MVRGVLTALALLLFAGGASAQPADSPPTGAPAAEQAPAETAPTPEAPPEPPPPPSPPLQAFAPIRGPQALPGAAAQAPVVDDVDDPARFIVGQVWSLKAPAAPSMRVRIGRVDDLNGRLIVSVSILGAPCPSGLGCETTDIAHMPFEQPTLTAAVDHVVARDAPSDEAFAQGYRYWRDNGRGAAWTQGPAEAAEATLEALPRRAATAPPVTAPAPPAPAPAEAPPAEATPAEAPPAEAPPAEATPPSAETPPAP